MLMPRVLFLTASILQLVSLCVEGRRLSAFTPPVTTTSPPSHPSSAPSSQHSNLQLNYLSSTIEPPPASRVRPRLHVTEINQRNDVEQGLPVVVLHGLLGSSRNFRSWANVLHQRLEKPRRIIIPDLRNHGNSDHVDDMSYDEMVEDLFSLLDEQGIGKAIILGHSMGGKVAAAAGLMDPDRVNGLVVMDIAPVTYSHTDGSSWQEIQQVIELLSSLPLDQVQNKAEADGWLADSGLSDPAMRAFALTNLEEDSQTKQLRWKTNIQAIKRSIDKIAAFEEFEETHKYPHKTLFVNGGKSRFVRSSHLSTISKLFPTFSLATVRQAGHWVHAEAPDETLAIVQRYLDQEVA